MAEVQLIVGETAWNNWKQFTLSADYTIASAGWSVVASAPTPEQLAALNLGDRVVLLVDGVPGLRGTLEHKEVAFDRDGSQVTLSGRDLAASLVDCSPGKRSWSKMSLASIAQAWLQELGLVVPVVGALEAAETVTLRVQAGETYWRALQQQCQRLGLIPWMSPAGELHLSRPDYDSYVVADLVLRADGSGNVLSLRSVEDLTQRFSEVTVSASLRTTGSSLFGASKTGRFKRTGKDQVLQALGVHRPTALDAGSVKGSSEAQERADWEVSKRLFDSAKVSVVVQGVGPSEGKLWQPNTQVHVDFEVLQLSGPMWIAGRQIVKTLAGGTVTTLDLREPGLLLPAVG